MPRCIANPACPCPPAAPPLVPQAADKAVKRKQRPPVREYIRHLVYDRLALGEVTKVSWGTKVCWRGGRA